MRQAVSRLTANDESSVTISVGVATIPGDASDKNALIGAADTALYFGKQSGGDKVVRASEVPGEMRDLRHTLDQLARTALLRPDDGSVESLAQQTTHIPRVAVDDHEQEVIDAVVSLARALEAREPMALGHGERVGNLAVRMATSLGCDANETAVIELAGRLHSLESLSAADLEPIKSLRGAALMVQQHRLGGGPAEVSIGAQIISVADSYDTLIRSAAGRRRGRAAALAQLRGDVGARFRGDVVEALAGVVAVRLDSGKRRREADTPTRRRGAA